MNTIDASTIDYSGLEDNELQLVPDRFVTAVPERNWLPAVFLKIRHREAETELGLINLRFGSTPMIEQLNGHIGYEIHPQHRGNSSAYKACRLLAPLAERLGINEWRISCDPANTASRKTIEKLGARLVAHNYFDTKSEAYKNGDRERLMYVWHPQFDPQAVLKRLIQRPLERSEIEKVWKIDRTEFIPAIYRCEMGELIPRPLNRLQKGWPEGEAERYQPILEDCFDSGGRFTGWFDGDDLLAALVVEAKAPAEYPNHRQLKFMYVDQRLRGKGLGGGMFRLASEQAAEMGATALYISSAEIAATVDFYRHMGCRILDKADRELYELEPADIHMEFLLK